MKRLSLLLVLLPSTLLAQDKKLRSDDRVLLLGGGMIEQERLHGFIESRLIRHHPDGKLLFRNLGWGGDTVRGTARTGGFNNPEGFARLMKEVAEWKPTVLFIGYGMNESFAGEAGLPAFKKDYEALLDKLAPLKARIILLTPTYHEPLGPPLPDPTEHNRVLARYVAAIEVLADERHLQLVDLFFSMKYITKFVSKQSLTTNGILPNENGYDFVSREIEEAMGYRPWGWRLVLSGKGEVLPSSTIRVEKWQELKPGSSFLATANLLPLAFPAKDALCRLAIADLPAGEYVVRIDGKAVARASAKDFRPDAPTFGITFKYEAFLDGGDQLRRAVIKKNDIFYRRWRPFNDHSRHFGFMKGDFTLYDKEIAAQEEVIRGLLQPKTHRFEIVPVSK